MKPLHLLLPLVALVVSSAVLSAAPPPLVWGNATTIAADSDIRTDGSLVYAYNFGDITTSLATTINGVTFSPFVIPLAGTTVTVGNVTVTESPAFLFPQDGLGSSTAPYSSLSSQYKAFLEGAVVAANPITMTVTLGGLTIGQEYIVQVWASNGSNTTGTWDGAPLQSIILSNGSPSTATLDTNSLNASGGVGQFAVGTFTAFASTQSFTVEGVGASQPLLNGLQLRAVPEPSSIALGLAGAAVIAVALRRRRRED